jgi:hypothetical protein
LESSKYRFLYCSIIYFTLNIIKSIYFIPNNRFGIIPCEKTKRPISKGEELTLDYEYDLNNCPSWFKAAFNSYVEGNEEGKLEETLSSKYLNYLNNS